MGKCRKHNVCSFGRCAAGVITFLIVLMGQGMRAQAAEILKINGVLAEDSSTDNTVWSYEDGVLTLKGTLDARNTGSKAVEFQGNLTIAAESGAMILADGQEGIYGSGNLLLVGDADLTVEAKGPYAVYVNGTITKQGNGELSAITDADSSIGIYAEQDICIREGGVIGKGRNYGVRAGRRIEVTSANLIGRGEYNAGVRAQDIYFNLGESGYVFGKTQEGEWGIRGDNTLNFIGSVEKPVDYKLKYNVWDGYVFYDVWGKTVQEVEIGKYTRNTAKPSGSTKNLNQEVLQSMNYKNSELKSWEQVLMALAKLKAEEITNPQAYGGAAVLEINVQESSGYIPKDAVNVMAGKENVGAHFYLGNGVSVVCMGNSIGTGYTGGSFLYQGSYQETNGLKEKTIDFTEKGWIGFTADFHVNLDNVPAGRLAGIYSEDIQGNRREISQCITSENGSITFQSGTKEKFVIVY